MSIKELEKTRDVFCQRPNKIENYVADMINISMFMEHTIDTFKSQQSQTNNDTYKKMWEIIVNDVLKLREKAEKNNEFEELRCYSNVFEDSKRIENENL